MLIDWLKLIESIDNFIKDFMQKIKQTTLIVNLKNKKNKTLKVIWMMRCDCDCNWQSPNKTKQKHINIYN